LTEMNFWRPGTPNTRVEPGAYWVFLLKPNTIAGCARVEGSQPLPLWLAWEAFGTGNGCDNRDELFSRIAAYRKNSPSNSPTNLETEIGCVGLTDPVFFDDPFDFEPYQSTWTNRTQATKKFSTASSDGAALWNQIQNRLVPHAGVSLGSQLEVNRTVRVRLGQGGFRMRVIESYDRRCAVTGEKSLPALEAAHIKPFAMVKEHTVNNGLLLRADIHKLFDLGYVTVTPDLRFAVSPSLREEYSNGRVYYELNGREIQVPAAAVDRPNPAHLDWHASEVFIK
jgi:putative restriction endonuclease